ncbi:MAG: LysM domain-containing protein [Candidatus Promineifilaceae bacterium]
MSDESNPTNEHSDQTAPEEQPIRSIPDHPPVRSQPVQTAPQPVTIRRPQKTRPNNLGEYIKFGILALILLGTPVVIALLTPFIFGQIVPAVLGASLPASPPVTLPGDQVVEPEPVVTPNTLAPAYPYPAPGVGIGGEATLAPTPTIMEPAATAVTVHIVRAGDTLESIAAQYGVTSADIAVANNLQNPNQLSTGTVLIIPSP